MNKNIFKNAYFGKPYKTKDGRKAILIQNSGSFVTLQVEDKKYKDHSLDYNYYLDGEPCYDLYKDDSSPIVSEWEEISEEELNNLADAETFKQSEEFDNCLDDILALLNSHKQLKTIYQKGLIWAFKAGYRKAKS